MLSEAQRRASRKLSIKKYYANNRELLNAKSRERNKKNRAKLREREKRYLHTPEGQVWNHNKALKYKYGITHDDYLVMLIKQNGVCAICKQTEKRKGSKYLSVDHDHKTGKVRGLLCHNCNRWLGTLESDWAIEAYKYLER